MKMRFVQTIYKVALLRLVFILTFLMSGIVTTVGQITASSSTLYVKGGQPLLTSWSSFSSNASDPAEGTNFWHLIDFNEYSIWHSNYHELFPGHYLDFRFDYNVRDRDVKIRIVRRRYLRAEADKSAEVEVDFTQPTKFKVYCTHSDDFNAYKSPYTEVEMPYYPVGHPNHEDCMMQEFTIHCQDVRIVRLECTEVYNVDPYNTVNFFSIAELQAYDMGSPKIDVMDMPGAIPLLKDASQIWSETNNTAGFQYEWLLDEDSNTVWETDWNQVGSQHWHDMNFDLRGDYGGKRLCFRYQNRFDNGIPTGFPQMFHVYTSPDLENWTDMGEFSKYSSYENGDYSRVDWIEFTPPGPTRYVRIYCKQSSSQAYLANNHIAIAEAQIYDLNGYEPAAALVYHTGQVSSTRGHPYGSNIYYLLDNNSSTTWCSFFNDTQECMGHTGEPHYLDVDLKSIQHADDNLKFVIRRWGWDDPLLRINYLDMYASRDGNNWDYLGRFDIPYPTRSFSNWQVSESFTAEGYRYLRFSGDKDNPSVSHIAFTEFRIYKSNQESNKMERSFFPSPATVERVENLEFVHTQGILDPHNHATESTYDYSDWEKWNDGQWTEDKELLESLGIEMPNFKYLEGIDPFCDGIQIDDVRQRTPTTYHELYALPGQALNLLAFSDVYQSGAYHETMIRWYDYQTDGTCNDIHFGYGESLDSHPFKIGGKGHFSGSFFGLNRSFGSVATFVCPEEGISQDKYIAVDFYQNVYANPDKNLDVDNGKLYEPQVAFRHIFKIRDGRKFAREEFSGNHEMNEQYVKAHKRLVTARANTYFHIRFDRPQEVDPNLCRTRSGDVYLDQNTGEYKYVETTRIAVFKQDGVTPCDEMSDAFYKQAHYVQLASTRGDGSGNLLTEEFYLARALGCNADRAKEGSYIVKVIGGDINRNDILLDGYPLVIQEWRIDFVNGEMASLISEWDLNNVKPEHSAEYLESIHGSPVAYVNFDEYSKLLESPNVGSYFAGSLRGDYSMGPLLQEGPQHQRRFKWPLPWRMSNYGYVFDAGHDYNMYSIANDFGVTQYHGGASIHNNWFDRLFIDTKGEQKGFFYYVNAASDPGEMVSVPIQNLCSGSTLYVSGWMNEMSGDEYVNLVLTFKVTTPDGESKKVHSYVTGYQPYGTNGIWHHFYYSFVVNFNELGIKADPNNKYELVLENNALSSGGADYAIDDIRVYVTRPRLYARQLVPVCTGEAAARIRTEIPFDVLLATMGDAESLTSGESSNRKRFHYVFLKKNIFDSEYSKSENYVEAFNKSILKYKYDLNRPSEKQSFGTVSFSTCYNDNPEYKIIDADGSTSYRAGRETFQGERWLVFNTNPSDEQLLVGSEYYLALYTVDDSDEDPFYTDNTDIASLFDIKGECSKVCEFRVHSSGIIKIDGIIMDDRDAITICVDQRPVVQIDVYGMMGDGKDMHPELLQHNAAFDWFDGPMSSVKDPDGNIIETGYVDMERNGMKLYDVMQNFRNANRDVTTLDNLTFDGDFTEDQAEWLRELNTRNESTGRTPLTINNVSFIFPPVKMTAEQDSVNIYVTAIPINRYEDTKYKVCTDPTEVRITVKNHSPNMRHGFPLAVTEGVFNYPEWLEDVPLRIGLKQVRSVWVDLDHPELLPDNRLTIPLRRISPVSKGVNEMVLTADNNIYLADTDDFDKILGKDPDSFGTEEMGLQVVGKIMNMRAVEGAPDNELEVVFDHDFNFREGHYYRLRFNYQEKGGETELDPTGHEVNKYCDGQHIFTLKIVPEYQKWTGAVSRNWANDANWKRVSARDLYVDPNEIRGHVDHEYYPYVTEGRHTCTQSYAPLDFCKVIVGDTIMYENELIPIQSPFLYDINAAFAKPMTYNGKTYFVYDPDSIDDSTPVPLPGVSRPDSDEIAERGEATHGIQYDMAPDAIQGRKGLFCRPMYTHSVDQIHFTAGGKIANQQYLQYNKAWVDMEVEPYVWHTLSSPLKETVAGNMYLPSASGRQESELFKPIKYNESLNNRFLPAVYQRAWNKSGAAAVHRLGESDENASIELTWSHVYNDVAENYSSGNAFAVKVDASGVKGNPGKVLFRFPKDDSAYDYFRYESPASGGSGTQNVAYTADNHYRLNDVKGTIKVSGANKSKYFMVGNPFMALMDMKKFIEKNPQLQQRYWLFDSKGEQCVYWDEFGYAVTTEIGQAAGYVGMGYLPPMKSVFVETIEETDAVELQYDESMIYQFGLVNGSMATRSETAVPMLRISVADESGASSGSIIKVCEEASNEYVSSEDALLITGDLNSDHPMVYTAAGDMAAIVNSVREIDNLSLGISAPDNCQSEIRFDGVDSFGPLTLYDSVSGECVAMYEGMTVKISGPSVGRYFIRRISSELESEVHMGISVSGQQVNVIAPGEGNVAIRVCDVAGRVINAFESESESVSFKLDRGIFLVDATKNGEHITRKVLIR